MPSPLGEGFWQGAAGLKWNVAAGAYTLAFSASAGFAGVMPGSAPNALATDWFLNSANSGRWVQDDNLDIGVRIDATPSAVPEPGTLPLLSVRLAGLAALRRRKH